MSKARLKPTNKLQASAKKQEPNLVIEEYSSEVEVQIFKIARVRLQKKQFVEVFNLVNGAAQSKSEKDNITPFLSECFVKLKTAKPESLDEKFHDAVFRAANQLFRHHHNTALDCANFLIKIRPEKKEYHLLRKACLEAQKVKINLAFSLGKNKTLHQQIFLFLQQTEIWKEFQAQAETGYIESRVFVELINKIAAFKPDSKFEGFTTFKLKDILDKIDSIITIDQLHCGPGTKGAAEVAKTAGTSAGAAAAATPTKIEAIKSDEKQLAVGEEKTKTENQKDPLIYLAEAEKVIAAIRKGGLHKSELIEHYIAALGSMPDNIDLHLGLAAESKFVDSSVLKLGTADIDIFSISFVQFRKVAKPDVEYDSAGVIHLFNGFQNLLLEKYNEALDDFKQAKALLPGDPWSHSLSCIAYIGLNKKKEAEEEVLAALQAVDTNIVYFAAHYLLCFLHFEDEISKDSLFLIHHYLVASCRTNFFNGEKLNRQIERIQAFVQEDRKKGGVLLREVTDTFIEQARADEKTNPMKAISGLTQAVYLSPDHVDALIYRGELHAKFALENYTRKEPAHKVRSFKELGATHIMHAKKDFNEAEKIISNELTFNPENLNYLRFRQRLLIAQLGITPKDSNEFTRIALQMKLTDSKIEMLRKKELDAQLGDAKIEVHKKPTAKQIRKKQLAEAAEKARLEHEANEKRREAEEAARKKAEKEAKKKAAAEAAKKLADEERKRQEDAKIENDRRAVKAKQKESDKETKKKTKREERSQRSAARAEEERAAAVKAEADRIAAEKAAAEIAAAEKAAAEKAKAERIAAENAAAEKALAEKIAAQKAAEEKADEIERNKVCEKLGRDSRAAVNGQANMTKQILEICAKAESDYQALLLKMKKNAEMNEAKRAAAAAFLAMPRIEKPDNKAVPLVQMKYPPIPVRFLESIPKQLEPYARFCLEMKKKTGHRFFLTGGSAFTLTRHVLLKEMGSLLNDADLEFSDFDTSTTANFKILREVFANQANFEDLVKFLREMDPANKDITKEKFLLALQSQAFLKNPRYPEREFSDVCLFPKEKEDAAPDFHISFCHNPKILSDGLIQDAWMRDLPINAFYWEFFEVDGCIKAALMDGTGLGLEHASSNEVRAELFGRSGTDIKQKIYEDPIQIIRLFYKAAKLNALTSQHDRGSIFNILKKEKPKLFEENIKIEELRSWVNKIFNEFFPKTDKLIKGESLKAIRAKQYAAFIGYLEDLPIMRSLPEEIRVKLRTGQGASISKSAVVAGAPQLSRSAAVKSPILFQPLPSPVSSPLTVSSDRSDSPPTGVNPPTPITSPDSAASATPPMKPTTITPFS